MMPEGTEIATAMVAAAPAAAIAAERLLQARPAIAIGSAERMKSGNASSVPPSGEMKRSEAAKPAPTPTRAICIIFVAVPPLERLGAGRGTIPAMPQPEMRANSEVANSEWTLSRLPHYSLLPIRHSLLDHVRQQAEEARPLDRPGEFALLRWPRPR